MLCNLWGLGFVVDLWGVVALRQLSSILPPNNTWGQQIPGGRNSQDGRMRDRWVLWDPLPRACWPGCSAQMQRQISFLAYQSDDVSLFKQEDQASSRFILPGFQAVEKQFVS